MKKIFFSLLIIIGAFSANANPESNYDFKFKVLHIKDSTCFMGSYFGDKEFVQDTAKIDAQGNFEFKGNKTLPGGVYFILFKNKKYFEFIVDKDQHISMETDTTDFINDMKVKNSKDNVLFYKYLHFIADKAKMVDPLRKELSSAKNKDSIKVIDAQLSAADKEVNKYKTDYIAEHPETFLAKIFITSQEPKVPEAPKLADGKKDSLFAFRYYKSHYFDNVDFSDARLIRTPIMASKLKEYLTKLTLQTPDSLNAAADYLSEKARANKEMFKYIVNEITSTYETSNIMGMDAVFVHMVKKYYATKQAFWIDSTQLYRITERAKTLDPILIGKQAPSLILPDTSGHIIPLDSVKAAFTIVYFWDYDCSYCKKVTPKLLEWYEKAKFKNIKVYAVQTNDGIATWRKYIDENKLDWINVSDRYHQSGLHQVYDVYSTPVIYLLDENKTIVAKRLDVEQLNELLKKKYKITVE
ncbi:MAG: redoxin domain-containing protein [Bacteroidia bacterium]